MRRDQAEQLLWPIAACLVAVMGGALAARGDSRVVLALVLAASLPMLSGSRLLGLAVASVLVLGLLRRLLSPGRIDYDPLLLLPLLLLGLAVVAHKREGEHRAGDKQNMLVVLLSTLPLVSQVVVGAHGLGALYGAAIQSAAFLTILLASNGHLPNLWPVIVKWATPISFVLSAYCLLQYYVLFRWDEQWMISSRLTSVGKPEPRLVRVFGPLESPGPCALILGIFLLILIVKLAGNLPLAIRAIHLAVAVITAYALILTGVRSALVGVAIALVFLALRTGNFRLAVITLAGFAAATIGISRVVSSSSAAGSSILSENRYNVSTIGSDDSLLARIRLFDTVVPALSRPLGGGVSPTSSRFGSADNALIDVLVNFGPAMALLFAGLLLIVIFRVARQRWQVDRANEASMVAVVVLILFVMLAGSVFTTTSGLFAALIIGWFLRPSTKTAVDPRQSARATSGTNSTVELEKSLG